MNSARFALAALVSTTSLIALFFSWNTFINNCVAVNRGVAFSVVAIIGGLALIAISSGRLRLVIALGLIVVSLSFIQTAIRFARCG